MQKIGPSTHLYRRGADKNLDSRLQAIKAEFFLNEPQIARQLIIFKEEKYGNSQIEIITDADQLEEQMRMSLSMEPIDYVIFTLKTSSQAGILLLQKTSRIL